MRAAAKGGLLMLLVGRCGRCGVARVSSFVSYEAKTLKFPARLHRWRGEPSAGARLLDVDDAGIQEAAGTIREATGTLVAFPTETVYGLGAAITDNVLRYG